MASSTLSQNQDECLHDLCDTCLLLPFHSLNNNDLALVMSGQNKYSNIGNTCVTFDGTDDDKHFGGVSEGRCTLNLLHELDRGNQEHCIFGGIPDSSEGNPDCFNIMHLNIWSLVARFEGLEAVIDILHKPQIIGISETWLNSDYEYLYGTANSNS